MIDNKVGIEMNGEIYMKWVRFSWEKAVLKN